MARNKSDERDYEKIARELGVSPSDVRSCVLSLFDSIERSFRPMPFSTPRKIFSRKLFAEYIRVWNIPYIGRIGPSYSRYLSWRANEAKGIDMTSRSAYRTVYTQEEVEELAKAALNDWRDGDPPVDLDRKSNRNYPFERVWLVGTDGKKQARQVIPKDKCSKSRK